GIDDIAFGTFGFGGIPVTRVGLGSGTGGTSGSGLLGGGGGLGELGLEGIAGGTDRLGVISLERFLDSGNRRLDLGLGRSGDLLAEFIELFFHGVNGVVGEVADLDALKALFVRLGVLLGLAFGLLDLVIAEAAGTFDGDVMLLAGAFVFRRNLEDS